MSPSADVSRQVLRHRTRGSQFMSMRRAKYAGGRPTVSGGQAERPSAATHGPPSPKALQRSQVPLGLLCVQVGFISTVLVRNRRYLVVPARHCESRAAHPCSEPCGIRGRLDHDVFCIAGHAPVPRGVLKSSVVD